MQISIYTKTLSLILLGACLLGCSHGYMHNFDLTDQKTLKPCERSSNCVSSLVKDDASYIPPIQLPNHCDAFHALSKALEGIEKSTFIQNTSDYIHLEVRSSLFGFIDDLELYIQGNTIHFRSAARSGYYDFNVNRDRLEKIRVLSIAQCR